MAKFKSVDTGSIFESSIDFIIEEFRKNSSFIEVKEEEKEEAPVKKTRKKKE